MNPFSRNDSLMQAAAENLTKIRNATLAETVYNTNHRSALDDRDLYYIEKGDNLNVINRFIKSFLSGTHMYPEDTINRLFVQLQTIGLSVPDFNMKEWMDGQTGSGTYEINQYGTLGTKGADALTNPFSQGDGISTRTGKHAYLKIKKSLQPGGFYLIDAEIYMGK